MKKVLIIVMMVMMVGCSAQNADYKSETKSFSTSDKIEIRESSRLIRLDSLDILKNSEGKIVYFGRETCPICQIYEPVLEETLDELNIEAYYFDTDAWRANDEFSTILDHYGIAGIPDLVYIKEDGSYIKQKLSHDAEKFDDEELLKQEIKKFLKNDKGD